METWIKISSLLCVFGFLKEFRPSEPYITPYLMSPRLNFTEEQIFYEMVHSYTIPAIAMELWELAKFTPVKVCGPRKYSCPKCI